MERQGYVFFSFVCWFCWSSDLFFLICSAPFPGSVAPDHRPVLFGHPGGMFPPPAFGSAADGLRMLSSGIPALPTSFPRGLPPDFTSLVSLFCRHLFL